MTGRDEPTKRDLENAIAKRMYHIEKRGESIEARFNRNGFSSSDLKANAFVYFRHNHITQSILIPPLFP